MLTKHKKVFSLSSDNCKVTIIVNLEIIFRLIVTQFRMAWFVGSKSHTAKQEKELLARTMCKGHCGHLCSGKLGMCVRVLTCSTVMTVLDITLILCYIYYTRNSILLCWQIVK